MAAACAKEYPVNVSETEGAVLTVSLPYSETKTALGEKAEQLYPVLWKEGDCLSLNGASSLPLTAEEAGAAKAGFVFRDGLSSPYNLLYPVSGEKDLVVFPETQVYVPDGFDPAAVPMWGSSATYSTVTLRHFFSLVRITVKTASPRVLKRITLTALGGEPISGSFRAGTDENGAFNGSLTVEDGAPELVYSFGEEGLQLQAGETATAYISIPIGKYANGFKAVVGTAGQEYRQLRFFSAGRTVVPGKVLEFPEKDFEDCTVIWEYFVSASGNGNGKSEDQPMSISAMLELLQNSDGTELQDATFHFTEGSHAITEPFVLPDTDAYDNPVSYTITGDKHAVLDGGGASRIFEFKNPCSGVVIKDLTLTNGSQETGGLVLIQNTEAVFDNCTFTNTTSTGAGGAVRVDTASKGAGTFNGCTFSNCTGQNGGAIVITNANTSLTLTDCVFSDNQATASGGALYSTNGITTLRNCSFTANKAANLAGATYITTGTVHFDTGCTLRSNSAVNGGGAVSIDGAGTAYFNGCVLDKNTSKLGGAFYTTDNKAAKYYVNACVFTDNKASGGNGHAIYLNTSNAANFATLCINNSTLYNTANMTGTNASLVCNKGKTIITNSTLYGTTSQWGTYALGCHKNYADPYGCLLLNCIFINTTAGKPAIYQTGANYYAIAKNCIASNVSSNTQFTQTNVIIEPPVLTWNGTLFTWDGNTTLPHWSRLDTETELSGSTYALASNFLAWLKSIKYNMDGIEYDALDVDQTGHLRSEYSWAGAYQK